MSEKWMILTAHNVQEIFEFCKSHNWENVIVFDEVVGGIANMTHIALQEDWLKDKNCRRADITDYERW